MSRKLLMLAAAALLPLSFSAQGAETAKEGTDKLVVHFVNGQSFSPMKQGEAVVYTGDDYGIQSASAGSLFDNLGVRCVGLFRFEGDKSAGNGYEAYPFDSGRSIGSGSWRKTALWGARWLMMSR